MFPNLTRKMASFFIANGIIPKEEHDVYAYSFEILLATLLNFIGIFIIMLVTKTFCETVFFLSAFLPLRMLVGGYHAKNHIRCFLLLMAIFIGFIFLVKYFPHIYIGVAVFVC